MFFEFLALNFSNKNLVHIIVKMEIIDICRQNLSLENFKNQNAGE